MKTCEYEGAWSGGTRSHPWTDAASDASFRYHDVTASPALIRTALEDFVPWSGYPAIQRFYALLEWLNVAGSPLESNDCALNGPQPNENPGVRKKLECSGRVMLLFRSLARNVAPHELAALALALHRALAPVDPRFAFGVIGTTLVPVRYVTLAQGEQLGAQLMISFWAWGDTEGQTMANLDRLMKHLARALRDVVSADATTRGRAPR